MDTEDSKFSHYLDVFFNTSNKLGDVYTYYKSCDNKAELSNIINRLWLIETIRHRSNFRLGETLPRESYKLIENEVSDLLKYLLITCIDSLSQKSEFITYDAWLRTKKTLQYKINNTAIQKSLINSTDKFGNITDPDNFRHAAAELFDSCYIVEYGNKQTIKNFLMEIPDSLQKYIIDRYLIIKTKIDLGVIILESNGKLLSDELNWDNEVEKWESFTTQEKINLVFEYLYNIFRNPYTHCAKSPSQSPHYNHNQIKVGKKRLSFDFYYTGETNYLVVFSSENIEDEYISLMLLVGIGWLIKTGYPVTKSTIDHFEKHLIKKEVMFCSIPEVEYVKKISDLYRNKSYQDLLRINGRWSMPYLPNQWINVLKTFMRLRIPFENSFLSSIEKYLEQIDQINQKIYENNQKYVSTIKNLIPDENEIKILQRDMPKAFADVQQTFNKLDIENKCTEITRTLNECTDWLVYYD